MRFDKTHEAIVSSLIRWQTGDVRFVTVSEAMELFGFMPHGLAGEDILVSPEGYEIPAAIFGKRIRETPKFVPELLLGIDLGATREGIGLFKVGVFCAPQLPALMVAGLVRRVTWSFEFPDSMPPFYRHDGKPVYVAKVRLNQEKPPLWTSQPDETAENREYTLSAWHFGCEWRSQWRNEAGEAVGFGDWCAAINDARCHYRLEVRVAGQPWECSVLREHLLKPHFHYALCESQTLERCFAEGSLAALATAPDRGKLKRLVRETVKAELKANITDGVLISAYLQEGSCNKAADFLRRETGKYISKDQVHRAIKRAGGAKAVCRTSDSESIQRTVASQRRDRQEKFASPAQPFEHE